MQICACYKGLMREVIDYVFCVLCMVCPGSAFSWNRQDLQQAKHATSAKHLVSWDWSVFCSNTNAVFQITIFLILVVRKNKSSSGIDDKTSDCLSKNLITIILSYVSATNCSLNRRLMGSLIGLNSGAWQNRSLIGLNSGALQNCITYKKANNILQTTIFSNGTHII